jgi:hypothetical protein
MKISKTHKRFAYILDEQRVLSHPEEFLGPNWKVVLNFWLYLDTLSPVQFAIVWDFYYSLNSEHGVAPNLAWDVADETVGEAISTYAFGAPNLHIYGYATLELIGAHKILEQGKPLTFTSLLLDL